MASNPKIHSKFLKYFILSVFTIYYYLKRLVSGKSSSWTIFFLTCVFLISVLKEKLSFSLNRQHKRLTSSSYKWYWRILYYASNKGNITNVLVNTLNSPILCVSRRLDFCTTAQHNCFDSRCLKKWWEVFLLTPFFLIHIDLAYQVMFSINLHEV